MDDLNRESIQRRLDAVERAVSDGDPIDHHDRLDELDARVAELEAAVQSIRGYVGTVRATNEEIEHRADIALRKAAALEQQVATETAGDGDGGDDEPVEHGRRSRLSGWL